MGNRCIYIKPKLLYKISAEISSIFFPSFVPGPENSYRAFKSGFTSCMRHLLCPVSHPFSPPFLQTLLWKPAANRCTWSDSATNLSLFDHSTDVVETCLASASQQPGYAKESALLTNGEQVWVNAVFCCAGGQFWSKFCKASPRVLMEGSPSCPQGDQQESIYFSLHWPEPFPWFTLPSLHSCSLESLPKINYLYTILGSSSAFWGTPD